MLLKPALQRAPFSPTAVAVTVSISFFYLLLSYFLVGFKGEQIVVVLLFNGLYYLSATTRKFILGFSIFIVYWILYDYMKAFPNYWFAKVHIEDLHNLELKLFGIDFNGIRITPNEYFKLHALSFLDILGGLFYLSWIPVPLGFAVYLFFKNRKQFLHFSFTFLWVNLIGFVIYYLYPAAPPWYVQEHGFRFIAETKGSTAGLARFDAYFNASIFKSIYSKGSNVFAAMPSLHSSYPLIVLYFGIKNRLGMINIIFGIVTIGIWFTAVYTSHHYILDVLAGITTGLTGIFTFQYLSDMKFVSRFLSRYSKLIS